MDVQFERPEFLFIIPVVFAAMILIGWIELRLIWKYVSRKRYAVKYALCFFFAFSLVIFLSDPYRPEEDKYVVIGSGQCAFLFDESRSMAAKEGPQLISRLERSKEMAIELSRILGGCQKAVYGFTSKVASHVSLTPDHDFIERTITHIVKIEAVGGTGNLFASGIKGVARDAFRDVSAKTPKTVFIWSDGGEELSLYDVEELRKELWKAKEMNIRFVVIGMGTKEGTLIWIKGQSHLTALYEKTPKFIAEETEGVYFSEEEWQRGMRNKERFLTSTVGLGSVESVWQGRNHLAPPVLPGVLFIIGLILFAKFR